VSLGDSVPGVRRRFPETPKRRSRPAAMVIFSRLRRPSPSSPLPGFDASRPAPVRGCGCRRRAVRRVSLGRRRDRQMPGRVRPSRRAGLAPGRAEAAREARSSASGADFTRAKPSWPSPACEPPVRSEPAPAGRLLSAGCRRRSSGTRAETPPPSAPSVSPTQSVRCRASGALRSRHRILPWHNRRPHARRSRPLAAC